MNTVIKGRGNMEMRREKSRHLQGLPWKEIENLSAPFIKHWSEKKLKVHYV